MVSRLAKWQLVAFVVVAVLGIGYVGAKYVRLDTLLGFGEYQVDARFANSGGIFTNAEVTYRGVPVGRVGDLTLTQDGVSVALMIDDSAPQIPASAKAVVANRSAIGEQYVDLQPDTDEGPFLTDGSVILEKNTATPIPVEDLIGSVDRLARSVPTDSLHTTVVELGKALAGKGGDLQVLVDSLGRFTETADEALPETLALISDGRTVFDTQADQAGAIRTFSDGLDQIAAQLKSSDPDVRRLIGTGKDASDTVGKLVAESGDALTTDLTNLSTTLTKVSPTFIALQPIFQFLPALSAGASAVAPGDGTIHFGLVLETNNPVPCTQGYEGTQEILAQMKAENPNFDDTVDNFPFNADARCTVPQGNPTGVRSAERIVYADPETPQPWDSTPKTDPDKLNLNPIATQISTLLGVVPVR
ncbi:MCE family protein [Prescottella equi]|jgi:phospholipid/cholesterol/gamma-HCH transport system substrate-binding protein|uniref:MCE family protein n=1 Tax=Rhodococcus hoagii TaxID=43767 RepID=A0AAE2WC30_RHOHA|nr:MlaD family protein [Prescottella equi]MBM4485971.1 MCE family protein [Prescottella equi]MBM4532337.1 MCE family protein [Prescottella equi]MBM4538108.1 MCE family protein [Prescottella equi]MBM4543540.1 MCE family protein [Prescottella equi]MBM4574495.1 MCE family protein [Prescottella equi]